MGNREENVLPYYHGAIAEIGNQNNVTNNWKSSGEKMQKVRRKNAEHRHCIVKHRSGHRKLCALPECIFVNILTLRFGR